MMMQPSPGLNSVLRSEALLKLIQESDEESKRALIEQLPEGQQSEEGLRENILSPQLRQAMQTLTQAIQSDQISLILQSLGLSTEVLNDATDGMDALIKALVKKYSKEQ